jgi:hypothetical protein
MNESIEISKELAPCPFCQSSNVHLTRDMYDTEEGRQERAQIRCWGCQLLTKTFKSNSEAVAYWNTRADPVVERQKPLPGDCEPFQKWVMATKHPVFGFLDDRSLARSDDLQGYADEYVQGLWVAYKEFALRPEPATVSGSYETLEVPRELLATLTISWQMGLEVHEEMNQLRAILAAPVVERKAVAIVIATGGPHDKEDRILCELQAELPPIGTRVYGWPPEPIAVEATEKLKQAMHDSANAETEEQRVTALAYWLDQQSFESGMLSCAAATLLSFIERNDELSSPERVVKQTTWADVQPWFEANQQMLKDVYRFEGLGGAALEVWRAAVRAAPTSVAQSGASVPGESHE